ncbi:MAG: radical SAM family heme chaperone HemW [Proteocatella sp.]
MKNLSLYLHIPFCKRKCAYCDFVSLAKSPEYQNNYIASIIKEMEMVKDTASEYIIDTVYIGGGTPSFLNETSIETLLESIHKNFDLQAVREFTFECNPESLDESKLRLLKKYKINRISLGLQSTDDYELIFLRRSHNFDTFLTSYKLVREMGFKNVSVDLMFTIPTQTIESFSASLKKVVELSPEHISCYSLIIEENTLMNRWLNEGKMKPVSDDLYVDMYRYMIDFLSKNGYMQYEISNFAKPGFESLHNSAYWIRQDYLGLGASSHSLIDNQRFSNVTNVDEYMIRLLSSKSPVDQESLENLSVRDILNERIFLGLRMNEGILLSDFEKIDDFYSKCQKLKSMDLIEFCDNRIRLTQKGRELSNSVFSELMID